MALSPSAHPSSIARHDLPLAIVVTVLLLIGTGVSLEDDWVIAIAGTGHRVWLPGPGGLALVLGGGLVLAFRHLAPVTVFAVSAGASLAYQALGYRPPPLPLSVLVALFTVAVLRRPLVCNSVAAAYVLAFTVAGLTGWLPTTDDHYYIELVSIVATVMLGYGVALGRARVTLAEHRTVVMAQDQDGRMRAAVEQEQSRIAREVHDIVAHDVSVIVAQAAAARRVFATQPKTAADALASIEAVGRDALDGLRRLVGLLRTDPGADDRSPQPGLDRLPWLLDQVRRAGLSVNLTVLGRPHRLPATVELNAFRIIQEALTNSLKHAGPTQATVLLDYTGESLHVEVYDQGGEAPPERKDTTPGYGLISMQQRAGMLGGELEVGPEPERGFRVSVRLPVTGGTG
jgi:signal transduction histidine kinase